MKSKAERQFIWDVYEEKKGNLIKNWNLLLEDIELFENYYFLKDKKLNKDNLFEILLDKEFLKKYNVNVDILAEEIKIFPIRQLSEVIELHKEVNEK